MDQKSPEAFRTISEVADWLGVPTHVLRFWESRFSQVKPVKRAGGRRYYRPSDMELLGGIRKLLHDDGMTIRGVQKLLREKGVKHVATLSPPLDAGPNERDVTPDNVVALSKRRETAQGDAVEDAEIVEETAEQQEERRFPFDDEPEAAAAPEPAEDEAEAPEEPVAEEEEPVAASAAEVEVAEPEEVAEAGSDVSDPLPAPETMDFLAHEAEPEVFEAEEEAEAEAETAETPAETPVETDAADAMSSPEALSFAAHEAEPEVVEDTQEAEEPADNAEPVEEPEPEALAPALVMPEIDDDPDDDDREAGALIAADLRGLRAAQVAAEIATLQALADRLDEIQRRFGSRDGARGSL